MSGLLTTKSLKEGAVGITGVVTTTLGWVTTTVGGAGRVTTTLEGGGGVLAGAGETGAAKTFPCLTAPLASAVWFVTTV